MFGSIRSERTVVSDWDAVHDTCRAIKAGLDLRMPKYSRMAEDIAEGMESGRLKEEEVDAAVGRVLKFVLEKTGDKLQGEHQAKQSYDRQVQHQKAMEIAAEGIVLCMSGWWKTENMKFWLERPRRISD